MSRDDAVFTLFANGATKVLHKDISIPVVESGGYFTPAAITGAATSTPERRPRLSAYPNPFNPSLSVTLNVPVAGNINVDIFDVAGRRIVSLWSGWVQSGEQEFKWAGKDDYDSEVPSGVYLVRARGRGWQENLKIVRVD